MSDFEVRGERCHGLGPDHCCYLEGETCPFLEMHTQEHRRWTCGLFRELGDWDAVHADPRYLAIVRPVWDEHGVKDCGDFGPEEVQCCWGQYEPVENGEIAGRTKLPPPGRFNQRNPELTKTSWLT